MATFLAHYQSIKKSAQRLVVAIADVNDLWPTVKEGFEARVPFRKACLNSKFQNSVILDKLPVEYILTTDSRLRSRTPQEQNAFCFQEPFAMVVLVTCEDLEEYKTILKPRLKEITQNEEREWFIVFVSKAQLANDQAGKLTRKIYNKIEVDFSNKKRERCCKLDMHVADAAFWEDVESKIVECIRFSLDRRVLFYEEEIRNLTENHHPQAGSFVNYFILKESLASMFQMTQLQDDALREYEELEQSYLESVNLSSMKQRKFGGHDHGDDSAALLDSHRKPLSQLVEDDTFREFDFRQYLFACQAELLFFLNRPVDVAARGYSFIISFSRLLSDNEKSLPFSLREVWVLTACMTLIKETEERFSARSMTIEAEKEFHRLQADLYSLARVKLMRLGDLIGYGGNIERTPCNSANLSMLPWPKPNIWPSIPSDAADRISLKGQFSEKRSKPFGITRKPLPLAPTLLLRDANRRRASLSVGNIPEFLESRQSFKESPAGDNASSLALSPGGVPPAPLRSMSMSANGDLTGSLNSPGAGPSTPIRSVSFGTTAKAGAATNRYDRPMKLPEICAAAEFAIQSMVTDEKLLKGLSSAENFEDFLMELTKAAADSYHQSWRKRHGVVLDGEVAAFYSRHGNYDSAAKLYEKVCAMYSGDGWHALLAEVLPDLAECQKQLEDLAGYLLSCIKLLSLEKGLLEDSERHTVQSEVLWLAHTELKNPVSVDVSTLITFSGRGGSPLKLCEGDPGSLAISVWSGFPGEITLDALSVTLIATFTAEEGVKVVRSAQAPSLKPGKNDVVMVLPPQRAGSYVLGVLTGQLGQLRLRSHTYCMTSALSSKGGSPESDDFLSLERPLRPVLEVSEPRPLVDITCVVSWGLLINEPQWLGLVIRPIDYSLKGSILHLSSGSGLQIEEEQICEIEAAGKLLKGSNQKQFPKDHGNPSSAGENPFIVKGKEKQFLGMKDGKVSLPDSASDQASILWLRVRAVQRMQKNGFLTPSPPSSPLKAYDKDMANGNILEDSTTLSNFSGLLLGQDDKKHGSSRSKDNQTIGVRKLDVKLEYGAALSRTYERTLTVQFLDPLRVVSRVIAKGSDSIIFLQVTLISQLNASITIEDAELVLQPGFVHVNGESGRPFPSSILPLVMAPSSESALLFTARYEMSGKRSEEYSNSVQCELEVGSTVVIKYQIVGDRALGAHSPLTCLKKDSMQEHPLLEFKSFLVLQMPISDPFLAVGMLPLPVDNPCVGEQMILQWRVERITEGTCKPSYTSTDQKLDDVEHLYYEVEADPDHWMLAGRKKGWFFMPQQNGGRVVVSLVCIPLIVGYVQPPCLLLPGVDKTRISNTPAGPHSICILPPPLCSSFCVKK
ncbi:hypothetical protein KP509_31G071500 [Ceratopteris richardii]|uniref:Trafficking protein particle complex II-specific subunit 130 homolog n=4 Tax=Ceratopteris richardii TaxID=49495 RepID=A0A8T2R0W6_CERRI|nr:hypothetical protein KP509_31G071500 [Ceratopteris richardii]